MPETGYTEENQDFVKFESFFEIVKSTETAEVDVQEQNEVQKFDEDIADEPKIIQNREPSEDDTEMDLAEPSKETEEDLSSQNRSRFSRKKHPNDENQ